MSSFTTQPDKQILKEKNIRRPTYKYGAIKGLTSLVMEYVIKSKYVDFFNLRLCVQVKGKFSLQSLKLGQEYQ
jgi:hypothetical protein